MYDKDSTYVLVKPGLFPLQDLRDNARSPMGGKVQAGYERPPWISGPDAEGQSATPARRANCLSRV
jgi:hypothetical protein